MKDQFILGFSMVLMFTSMFGLGWFAHDMVGQFMYQQKLNGFYMHNASYDLAKDYQQNRDKYGDWVCVNVRGMDYSRAIEVCQHEVGHEIFAEVCEVNITKCLGVLK